MKNKTLATATIIFILFGGGCKMQRAPTPGFGFSFGERKIDESSLEYKMEMALRIRDEQECYNRVEELLKQGANPDKKTGQFKWIDTNPLWRSCAGKRIPQLLISYGADVKKRPYVAKVLSVGRIIAAKNPRKDWVEFIKENPQMGVNYEEDTYNACKVLLEAGADPNMKAYGGEKLLLIATDWNYNRFFKKHGETAINQCIDANLLTVFELLISYDALLDEKSLELAKENAERTGSTEMQDLVLAQWEKQNKK